MSNEYGFSAPAHLIANQDFEANTDVSMVSFNGDFYLTYGIEDGGTNKIWIVRFTGNAWLNPVETAFNTDKFPTLVVHDEQLLGFWKDANSKLIYFGTVDPETCEICGMGYVPEAETKDGVAVVDFGGDLLLHHLGSSSDTIYQNTLSGGEWSDDEKIKEGQSSQDAPTMVASSNEVFMVHRGSSTKKVYESSNASGGYDQWSKNEQILDAGSAHRAGIGLLGAKVVVVHRGSSTKDLRCIYMKEENEVRTWYGDEKIGSDFKSSYAPALCEYNNTLYMVFVNNDGYLRLSTTTDVEVDTEDSKALIGEAHIA